MARALPVPIALALLTGACAVTTAGGERLSVGSDAFRAYVERVFREQNRVATELAFALERENLSRERVRELEAAEAGLLQACADLNELAAARRDGESLGAAAEAGAARSAPECERATLAAARVLDGTRG